MVEKNEAGKNTREGNVTAKDCGIQAFSEIKIYEAKNISSGRILTQMRYSF